MKYLSIFLLFLFVNVIVNEVCVDGVCGSDVEEAEEENKSNWKPVLPPNCGEYETSFVENDFRDVLYGWLNFKGRLSKNFEEGGMMDKTFKEFEELNLDDFFLQSHSLSDDRCKPVRLLAEQSDKITDEEREEMFYSKGKNDYIKADPLYKIYGYPDVHTQAKLIDGKVFKNDRKQQRYNYRHMSFDRLSWPTIRTPQPFFCNDEVFKNVDFGLSETKARNGNYHHWVLDDHSFEFVAVDNSMVVRPGSVVEIFDCNHRWRYGPNNWGKSISINFQKEFLKKDDLKIRHFEQAILLAPMTNVLVYYHMLVDEMTNVILPTLHNLIMRYPEAKLLVGHDVYQNTILRNWLKRFDVDVMRLVEIKPQDTKTAYFVDHLIAPNAKQYPHPGINMYVKKLLNNKLGLKLHNTVDDYILVVNGVPGSGRSISNIDEVLTQLRETFVEETFVYKEFDPYKDWDEQENAELFNNAKIVVSNHGDALANLIYAPYDTVVVETLSNNKRNQLLSHTFSFPYIGVYVPEGEYSKPWTVDPQEIVVATNLAIVTSKFLIK
eukprot:TRINITY_DN5778_c0_g5_i1.p1 TRINITY_DN5778_c0_g5~~TRINITY_DN5778_c0_g5_i1.p1  ORF type:complete len:562 (-),score=180.18 TRINITY_DN5778_c0_g5_i1:120-1766(-)